MLHQSLITSDMHGGKGEMCLLDPFNKYAGVRVAMDTTNKIVKGRVNIRRNEHRRTCRLRFNGVHPDMEETIVTALKMARQARSTEYDIVALTDICSYFLANFEYEGPTSNGG